MSSFSLERKQRMDETMLKYAGRMIRREREKRSWNQEGLCRGICAVSYLSKIETGKTACSPEIIRQLSARLGITWHEDAEFCEEAEKRIRAVYERICSLEETEEDVQWFRTRKDLLLYSPYAADAAVLDAWLLHHAPRLSAEEQDFSDEQAALLQIASGKEEEALRLWPCALTYYHAGTALYGKGEKYGRSIDFLQQAYRLAAEEGRVRLMLMAKIVIGNWYSNLGDLESMEENYAPAVRIAEALHDSGTLRTLNYNRCSSWLEAGRYGDAYAYFRDLDDPGLMELHKYAVACEKTGRMEEARKALERGRRLPEYAGSVPARMMYDLVERRIRNTAYLQDAAYGKALLETFTYLRENLPAGYAVFHLPWVLEWYTASRQYRAAYELLRNFLKTENKRG